MIDDKRRALLHWYWSNETSDPGTLSWRSDEKLSSEESALIEKWDIKHAEEIKSIIGNEIVIAVPSSF